jgi:NAD(P)-dependent dehydrogenase (short-subunit alcohol dehydrogenase family)
MSANRTTSGDGIGPWTTADIPPQKGRLAVVTGTGGLGWVTALELARAGCEVIIAGRDVQKGAYAVEEIFHEAPAAAVRFEQVDLADLVSVKDFAKRLRNKHQSVDLLINNAGVMTPPKRLETVDGFELQFGTNYLGHFALTTHLMPLLLEGSDPRVVSVSSVAARNGTIHFDDLQAGRGYKPMAAYSQSKLACLMFAMELQRRSEAGKWGISSIAAHPGIARTDLLRNGAGRMSAAGLARTFLWFLFQPVEQGALPSLYAATSPDAKGAGYYGPAGLGETRGAPTAAVIPKQALDQEAASRLWEISKHLVGGIHEPF